MLLTSEPIPESQQTAAHSALVRRAANWLRSNAAIPGYGVGKLRRVRCGVVATETTTASSEIADAIGWFLSGRQSILIECKTSRSDFHADSKKLFRRRPDFGMGTYRYFLCQPGLIKPDELPERWGLLETNGKRVKVVKVAARFEEYHRLAEQVLLFSIARRTAEMVSTDVAASHELFAASRRENGRLSSKIDKQNEEIRELRMKLLQYQHSRERSV